MRSWVKILFAFPGKLSGQLAGVVLTRLAQTEDRIVKFEKESGTSTKSDRPSDMHRVEPENREPRTP